MTLSLRAVNVAVRPIVAAAFFSAMVAAPAVAQQSSALGPSLNALRPSLNLSASLATAETAAPPAGDPQAPPADPQAPPADAQAPPPAPTPAEIAAKQDSATMDFFRRTEISGFADMYYTYNVNKPAKPCLTVGGVAVFNCLYNFNVAHNSFSMQLAELALEKKPTADSRAGYRIDLDFGPTTAYVHGAEPGGTAIYQNVQQAYVSYLAPAGTGLQLDFGKFVTWNGQEVIETKDNWNYSRSLLFSWAIPYYHTGMRAAYSINDKVSVMGFLVNGWNNAVDNNTGKTVGAQLMFKPTPALMLMTNYTGGPETNNDNKPWRHLSDNIVTYTVNKQVSLAANYDYGQDKLSGATVKWQGVAGYLKYQANDWFALSPRVEYYNDRDGFTTGVAQKVKEATVTAEFKSKDGFLMRLEYRGDFSDIPYFLKNTAEQVKKQNTVTFGFVYAFSTKAS